MLGVDLPLPVHSRQVFVAVHEGCRDQPFAAIPCLFTPLPEMLDVDAAFGQPEIGLVIARADLENRWLATPVMRKPKMVAAVALANKMARMIWALTTKEQDCRMA
jgi:hypothetical protein